MNRQIILKSRPVGMPVPDNFALVNTSEPEIKAGEVKVKAKFISVDPYMRGWMNERKHGLQRFEISKPIWGYVVAEVIETRHSDFTPGDAVTGMLLWQEIQNVSAEKINRLSKNNFPLSIHLSILGMTGMTAYFGLMDIGRPKKNETVVVSGAAGAVGMVAGQLAGINNCYVVGIAGSDEKTSYLKEKLHFDDAVNYHATEFSDLLAKACPKGVDIYFDNVGGEISDAVLPLINPFARIIVCGQISLYNKTEKPFGPRVQPLLLEKSALMQGFSSTNYTHRYPEAIEKMSKWILEGRLNYEQTILKRFEKLPEAFVSLFQGKNIGKLLVETE